MAECVRHEAVVEVVKRVISPESYDLKLSKEEALFLCDVMRTIGGDRLKSRRKISNDLLESFRQFGLGDYTSCRDFSGSLRFEDSI